MAFITNQTQLELKAGTVVTRRDNAVYEAAADLALGSIAGFDATGKLVAATATTVNPQVVYRNNGFKETYNAGDSVNVMKDGEVYLTQEAGQDLKQGQQVMVGATNNAVIVFAAGASNVVLGTVQEAPTTNGVVRIKLGA